MCFNCFAFVEKCLDVIIKRDFNFIHSRFSRVVLSIFSSADFVSVLFVFFAGQTIRN